MKTGWIIRFCALAATFFVLYLLWNWTYDAFYPPVNQIDEALTKPWRPWARLALSAILAVLMLGTQAFIAVRRIRH
jgi:heme A synthase